MGIEDILNMVGTQDGNKLRCITTAGYGKNSDGNDTEPVIKCVVAQPGWLSDPSAHHGCVGTCDQSSAPSTATKISKIGN